MVAAAAIGSDVAVTACARKVAALSSVATVAVAVVMAAAAAASARSLIAHASAIASASGPGQPDRTTNVRVATGVGRGGRERWHDRHVAGIDTTVVRLQRQDCAAGPVARASPCRVSAGGCAG